MHFSLFDFPVAHTYKQIDKEYKRTGKGKVKRNAERAQKAHYFIEEKRLSWYGHLKLLPVNIVELVSNNLAARCMNGRGLLKFKGY